MRGSVGEIAAAPGGPALGPAILEEAAAVAAAAGHPLPPGERAGTAGFLTAPGSAATSSLYRDLQEGRATEVEHIFGDLIQRARSFGLATPLLDLVTLALRVHGHRLTGQAGSGSPEGAPAVTPRRCRDVFRPSTAATANRTGNGPLR
jgi:2-dehydropantoate 2-reductase